MEAYHRRRHRELTWLAVAIHNPEDLEQLKPKPADDAASDLFDTEPW